MSGFASISDLYVSPTGGGSGLTPDSPASLLSALTIAAELRGGGILQPISIRLRGDLYTVDSPITISNPLFGITIEPYGNEKPVISGSKELTGFADDEFMGKKCLSVTLPEVKSGKMYFIDLYKNGKPLSRPRMPEAGAFLIKADDSCYQNPLFFAEGEIYAKDPLPDISHAITDIEFRINQRWIDEHSVLNDYDAKTGRIELKNKTVFRIEKNDSFWFENVAESFGKPGQWYLDRESGKLYYTPETGEKAEDLKLYAPLTGTLIKINGRKEKTVRNISLKGLTFEYTSSDYLPQDGKASDAQSVNSSGGAVEYRYAESCEIKDCTITAFGLYGVNIADGCRNIRVNSCDLIYGGAGGVRINGAVYGGDERDMTSECSVEYCRIAHCGRRWQAGCGVLLMNAFSCAIAHNDIYDLFYTGISAGWVWGYTPSVTRDIRIEYNRIHTIGQGQLSDMGGVYLLGSQPGTVVRNNIIWDIKSHDYGGWALYTDEGSAGILLESNICYDTSENGYHQHYGTSNTVRNNIFALTKGELLRITRTEMHLSIIFEHNIIYSSGTPVYGLSREHAENGLVASDYNVIWSENGSPVMINADGLKTIEEIRKTGMDRHSIVADPLFKNVKNCDFTLSENSPAFATGFKKIETAGIGSGKDEI